MRIQHSRLAGIPALVLLFAVATGAVAGTKVQSDDRRTVTVDQQTLLTVENPRGRIVVVGTGDSRAVTIVATKVVHAGSREEADDIMKRLDYEISELEDEIRVVTRYPEGIDARRGLLALVRGERRAEVSYAIEIPSVFSVRTATTSGGVRVTGIKGSAEVQATSGDVTLEDIGADAVVNLTSGRVEALSLRGGLQVTASSGNASINNIAGPFIMQATSGNVNASRVGGDMRVELVSGNMVLSGCLGSVDFSTSSGNAEIHDVAGSISAITSSGDLDVMILPVGEKHFMLSSSSGDIGVSYPTAPDYGFVLDVNTSTGSIEGDMAIDVKEIDRRRLRGVVGTGKSRVMIETASGNVKIVERKEKHD